MIKDWFYSIIVYLIVGLLFLLLFPFILISECIKLIRKVCSKIGDGFFIWVMTPRGKR